jgi:hypothetical protein
VLELITKKQAIALGKSRYFLGTACKYGHIAERLTANGTCCDCIGRISKTSYHREGNPSRQMEKVRQYRKSNIISVLVNEAKHRAKKAGVPFSLDKSLLVCPTHCPVLGLELLVGREYPKDNHPSLDRVIPSLGYVDGNVIVVSQRANRIKNDATLQELETILSFYSGLTNGN